MAFIEESSISALTEEYVVAHISAFIEESSVHSILAAVVQSFHVAHPLLAVIHALSFMAQLELKNAAIYSPFTI